MFQLVDMNQLLESYVYYLYTEDAPVHHRDFNLLSVGINTSVFMGEKNIQKKNKDFIKFTRKLHKYVCYQY